jgi:hypothetical protein
MLSACDSVEERAVSGPLRPYTSTAKPLKGEGRKGDFCDPLRKRTREESQALKLFFKTIRGYIFAVREFAEHYGKSLEPLRVDELRCYQVHLLQSERLRRAR